jgi:ribosomal protein S18 acetylase RimI-like enzyme
MLCIVPEMQHKSIGSAAIAKVMSLSSYLQKTKALYLNVFVCNRAAYNWYSRIGFVEIETKARSTLLLAPSPSPALMERRA